MSRIFENCIEAINEIERDIMEMGILVHPNTMQNKYVKDDSDYDTLEVQNYSFTILNMKDKHNIISNKLWCLEEIKERTAFDFKNPGKAWELRRDVWEEFLNAQGEMDYTYNERIYGENQLIFVIEELEKNPDTRQALIHIHYPSDAKYMGIKRIPCSTYYQFMIRRGKLDIIYNMRSSDFDTHFKNDIWLADDLRNFIAKKINIKPGLFHMNIGSLHRYRNYTKEHIF